MLLDTLGNGVVKDDTVGDLKRLPGWFDDDSTSLNGIPITPDERYIEEDKMPMVHGVIGEVEQTMPGLCGARLFVDFLEITLTLGGNGKVVEVNSKEGTGAPDSCDG